MAPWGPSASIVHRVLCQHGDYSPELTDKADILWANIPVREMAMNKMMRWETCQSMPHSIMGQRGMDSDPLSSIPWGTWDSDGASH